MSHLIRVGVLRGGPSNEHEVSLNSGAAVIDALNKHLSHAYEPIDIFVGKDGSWSIAGRTVLPAQALQRVDVVFNALHGAYGEDGHLQSFLETHSVPFTGSGAAASSVGMNKILSKKVAKAHGLKTPHHVEFLSENVQTDAVSIAKDLFQSFVLPAVVKPANSGSSVGVSVVRDYADIPAALKYAADHSDVVMVEEFIPGVEATCGVIDGFRGHEMYMLPPIEIRPTTGFFDYNAKYGGQSQEIVPSTFTDSVKREIQEMAEKIHRALGLRHYSRSDFMVHPRRGVYFLEVNTLPGLTGESLVPKALRAVGSDTHEFVDHVLRAALGQRD